MKKLLLLSLSLALTFFVTACDGDDDDNPSGNSNPPSVKTKTVDATNYSNWKYFSFETGDTLTITDPKSSTDWDLAFLRNHLRTNSGASGNGQGGVVDKGVVSFSSVTQAPESGYVADDSVSVVKQDMSGYYNTPGSTVLEGWMTMDMSTMPPGYNYNNNIYVVKTAKGKYAKIQLKNYKNAEGKTGHITFEYLYQSDGTKNISN